MLRGEIIAIGSELLIGGRRETNSAVLIDALSSAGIDVRFKTVVGDEKADIVSAVRVACRRAQVVVTTGGLGPTVDDRTREGVAEAVGRPLRKQARAVEEVRRRLAEWKRAPAREQLRQAMIPMGAEILTNPIGSAPGFSLRSRGRVVFCLPGVPAELGRMIESEVLPRLSRLTELARQRAAVARTVLHTFDMTELEVQRRLRGLLPQGSGIRLGLLASPLGVTISLTSSKGVVPQVGPSGSQGSRTLSKVRQAVRRRLGLHVYGEGADSMEEVIGDMLSVRALTLAVAESCTGGLICHRLTDVPGSSRYFERGVICYSNQAKQELLGVGATIVRRYGAVSAQVAAAMARGVCARSRASIGLSVTGIAGPGGGSPQKPVGLVYIGLASEIKPGAVLTKAYRFHGDRHMIKLRSSQAALDFLRLYLIGLGGPVES